MEDFELEGAIPCFATVGMLRELLKNHPDDTPIYVCGTPGLFYPNAEQQYILLETMDCSGYETLENIDFPAAMSQEYMDF